MAKNYIINTFLRTAKPRSKKLRGLSSSSSTVSSGTSANSGFAAFKSKFDQMFILVDANGNQVSNVSDAVAVSVTSGLSLYVDGDVVANRNT